MQLKHPVSLDEAMKHLVNLKEKTTKITDLAGTWDITDKELAEIKTSLKEAWKRWKTTKS